MNLCSACIPAVYSLVTSWALSCGERVVRFALVLRLPMYVESSIGVTVWLRWGVLGSGMMFVVVWWCGPSLLKVLTRRGAGFTCVFVDGGLKVGVFALYSTSKRLGCRSPMAGIAL